MGPGLGNLSQNVQKPTPLRHHSQKNQNLKIIFHCKIEDSPSRLRVWTAL